ncbi:hypothetical protein JOE66_000550 [Subtercola frigoramans]|uniref:Uncharacterized protein n=1 Tax=Subtercola frigoramans TaxID=120298 RepID=A0ABS2L1U5_9MICO|nr:hypothetical protein [Subtercola frigoramans]
MNDSLQGRRRDARSTLGVALAYILFCLVFILRMIQAFSHGSPDVVGITFFAMFGLALLTLLLFGLPVVVRNTRLRRADGAAYVFTSLQGNLSTVGISPSARVLGKEIYAGTHELWASVRADEFGLTFWGALSMRTSSPSFEIAKSSIIATRTTKFRIQGLPETGVIVEFEAEGGARAELAIRPASRWFFGITGTTQRGATRTLRRIDGAVGDLS